jgi:hypothetical protein
MMPGMHDEEEGCPDSCLGKSDLATSVLAKRYGMPAAMPCHVADTLKEV